MSTTPHGNLQVLHHLAHHGPCTVSQLLGHVHESRPALNTRLITMESRGWLKKTHNHTKTCEWGIHPAAYSKLKSLGIEVGSSIPQPSPRTTQATQAHSQTLVQPARRNVYEAPVWKGWGCSAPVRAGAMDFMSYPSRGTI